MQERPDPHSQPSNYPGSQTIRTPADNQRKVLGPEHVQCQHHFEDRHCRCHSTWHPQYHQRIWKTSPHSYQHHQSPIRRTRYHQLSTTSPQQNRRISTKVRFIQLETTSLSNQILLRSPPLFQMQENGTYSSKLPDH